MKENKSINDAYHGDLEELCGVGRLTQGVVHAQKRLRCSLLSLGDGVNLSLVCPEKQLELLQFLLIRYLFELY